MPKQPLVYVAYLLRMWRTGEHSAWKVSLEDPYTGERLGFNGLNTLFGYLQQQTDSDVQLNQDKSNSSKGE